MPATIPASEIASESTIIVVWRSADRNWAWSLPSAIHREPVQVAMSEAVRSGDPGDWLIAHYAIG
jgi:hypothetical protein